jgi:hypothetical protein
MQPHAHASGARVWLLFRRRSGTAAEKLLWVDPEAAQQISVLFGVDRVRQFLVGLGRLRMVAPLPEQVDDLLLVDLHVDSRLSARRGGRAAGVAALLRLRLRAVDLGRRALHALVEVTLELFFVALARLVRAFQHPGGDVAAA